MMTMATNKEMHRFGQIWGWILDQYMVITWYSACITDACHARHAYHHMSNFVDEPTQTAGAAEYDPSHRALGLQT